MECELDRDKVFRLKTPDVAEEISHIAAIHQSNGHVIIENPHQFNSNFLPNQFHMTITFLKTC